ncbi:MAG: dTDP-4-dehydrorhamnose reductase [Myxococcota bacterium]
MALIIGGGGQLGSELVKLMPDALAPSREELDLTDQAAIADAVKGHNLVINTAAFLRVDDCEDEREDAWRVNVEAVQHLAKSCAANDAKLVHISTDYVFGGQSERRPLEETNSPKPLNVYGITKLAGEHAALAYCPDALVVRSAGLYGFAGSREKGGNFVLTMLRVGRERDSLRVVDDQRLTPTFTTDLAAGILGAIRKELRGPLHITNGGDCSWYEFAKAIFELADIEVTVEPIPSSEYPTKATRPPYSVLSNDRLHAAGVTPLRPWRDALAAYLKDLP